MLRNPIVFLTLLPLFLISPGNAAATVRVAAVDAPASVREQAEFRCDGEGDQEEINAAIQSLPESGGTVELSEGLFDIRRVEGKLGGVLIEKSNVMLAGQGPATRLVQAPAQETNVIRIIGEGVGNITIRDLYVDANRDANPLGEGDPDVSHARFEFCGIKAFYTTPGGSGGNPCHDVTIRNCTVRNARRLGIMLEGTNMRVLDNILGNALSDAVEILTGPGMIRGNYVDITGKTHVAIGTDRADNIIMGGNIVNIEAGGDLDIGFRSWAQSQRHTITGNILTVMPGGKCGMAMDIRGFGAVVTGNNLHGLEGVPLQLIISAGKTVVTGNLLENIHVLLQDQTPEQLPNLLQDNLLISSTITKAPAPEAP